MIPAVIEVLQILAATGVFILFIFGLFMLSWYNTTKDMLQEEKDRLLKYIEDNPGCLGWWDD